MRAPAPISESCSSELGRHGEAVEAFREAIRVKPHRPLSHRGLGAALFAQGFFAEAEVAYREALRLRPDDAQSHFNLWTVLEKQDKHAESEAAYREAIRVKPDHAEAHCAPRHRARASGALGGSRGGLPGGRAIEPGRRPLPQCAGGRPSAAAIASGSGLALLAAAALTLSGCGGALVVSRADDEGGRRA